MPPSPVTSMKPPKSIFDIDSPPRHAPPTASITSSTLAEPKIRHELGHIFDSDGEEDVKPEIKKEPSVAGSMAVKLNKVEEMTGFEKLRDGCSSIKLPKDEPKSMLVSIPMQVIIKFASFDLTEFST